MIFSYMHPEALSHYSFFIRPKQLRNRQCSFSRWSSRMDRLPNRALIRFYFRLIFAYHISVTEANQAPGKIIYLGACLIAAVRLAREENWNNSPRVVSRISDSILMAKRIYARMKDEFPGLAG
jgi:hypothetical protein